MSEQHPVPEAEEPAPRFSFSAWLSSPKALRIIVWVGIAGMVLIMLSALFDTPQEESAAASASLSEEEDYAAAMEQKLGEMLLCVDGVSDCCVMVTLENDGRVVYAEDGKEPLTECEPTVRGVVVVVQGPIGEGVEDEVRSVVKTALHLAEKRVCVVANTSDKNQ